MEKQYVRSLFDSIAYRYDLLNHLLSGGVDLYWRRKAIQSLQTLTPKHILDVATGTCDLAIAAVRLNPVRIVGIDISGAMLSIGKRKLEARGLASIVELQHGDAEDLQFPDGMFDAAMVAFGARNFENLDTGLKEMYRVLRNNGVILVLEFSRPSAFPFKQLYQFYFLHIVPLIGKSISRNTEAYSYLPETAMAFPEGEEFLAILRNLGFQNAHAERLTFGIASVYTARKP